MPATINHYSKAMTGELEPLGDGLLLLFCLMDMLSNCLPNSNAEGHRLMLLQPGQEKLCSLLWVAEKEEPPNSSSPKSK